MDEEILEKPVKILCLPFLRIASLIQSHLYSKPWSDIEDNEFASLSKFLELDKEARSAWLSDHDFLRII